MWYIPYYDGVKRELRVSGHGALHGRSLLSWMDEALPVDMVALYAEDCCLARLPDALPPTLRLLAIEKNVFEVLVVPEGVDTLFCSRNPRLRSIPSLPSTLQILVCTECPLLTQLPPLPASLLHFACGDCGIIELPTPLPSALEILNCRDNRLTRLPPLPPSLRRLVHSGNPFMEAVAREFDRV